ncbi:Alpha-ketoglutarate-dependent taurine dioxygenase [Pantoea ananatis]|uniref:Alpha-ketoglutarate-dependent taurine dioxygenase n=1 Tax=Pantoea ananas TaxID=553 RepID=A0AAJ1FQ85_PANAN|nr:taurine dioxygenase [Pantoea ananatis]MCW0318623.1 Alpha-ketoglutarate-dependent taurine dioxygenase [Pantoea ananatis]MCW0336791.1 Alpha-ketoglutarate-dependent taurine dioxygenase [Pantoea ananatis]MCW0344247.1 Alpha-ketoglutarate-dependent taurine dioxygenase [Pantoea ananatis]MCW0384585.1 Alpha-ketoglutarate-dependent taurine dioxygenase [Pantoea ananatis]MCW0409401.1 Alpha-ketoglutarate-dependent taurine dioxygenase [Pantoea ananatis]
MNEKLAIKPLGPFIGAQVGNLDVSRPLSDAQFEQLYHALLRHQVLFLREQVITPEQHRALAIRFGDLHIHPVYPHAEGVEEIIVLDTHQDNPPDNDNWHTDVTFIQTPPAVALLASKVLPESGGDTLWTSGIAAYEALSAPFKILLAELRAEHDFTKAFPEYKHRKTEEAHRQWQQAVAKNPPVYHPVIRTHPVSGKKALFVNEGFTTRIMDISQKESDALLGFLFAHVTRPEFQVRWRWQPNDLAIWDNRVTQHYANADYYPARRVMQRATVLGDRPY